MVRRIVQPSINEGELSHIAQQLVALQRAVHNTQKIDICEELGKYIDLIKNPNFTHLIYEQSSPDVLWWPQAYTAKLIDDLLKISMWKAATEKAQGFIDGHPDDRLYTVRVSVHAKIRKESPPCGDGSPVPSSEEDEWKDTEVPARNVFYNEYTGFVTTVDLESDRIWDRVSDIMFAKLKDTEFPDLYEFLPSSYYLCAETEYDIIGMFPPPLKKGSGAFDFAISAQDICGKYQAPHLDYPARRHRYLQRN